MKKYGNSLRILFLCIAGVFCVMLFTSEEAGQRYFCGMVLEISDQYFLVEPDEGEEERKSADRITVPTNVISAEGVPEVKVGDEIRIVYDGEIMESYPARLSTGFAIDRADDCTAWRRRPYCAALRTRSEKALSGKACQTTQFRTGLFTVCQESPSYRTR